MSFKGEVLLLQELWQSRGWKTDWDAIFAFLDQLTGGETDWIIVMSFPLPLFSISRLPEVTDIFRDGWVGQRKKSGPGYFCGTKE